MGKLYCRILQAAAKGPILAISGASAANKISLLARAEFAAAVASGKIEPHMKSIIVGTAGHIDHGKTALVKALTGIDADRLEEEKRRGITIDLGFAHTELATPSGEKIRIGFVDVPGHEKFVRNMLAGVGGIDLVLLVIAADEGIMPQTREHLEILKLLDVRRGITVLTKKDAVDRETLDVVRLEVEEFISETFLEYPSPVIAVSSLTGAGIDELKRALIAEGLQSESRDAQAIARLPIDRVFTMKGFGTVVTGTLIAGSIRREDELEIYPGGKRVRVRGIQVHGQLAERAAAGQRTALNLAGATTEELSRGMMLAPPRIFETTRRIDVKLHLLPSTPRPLKNRARVHFHSHTMESVAEILLLKDGRLGDAAADSAGNDSKDPLQLLPGHSTLARLKLSSPALLLPGDHFIIREFSPVITIGGGVVLDALPVPRSAQSAAFLRVLDEDIHQTILQARIARRGREGISLSRLISETAGNTRWRLLDR
jgi:selenocysteine-specific elongation factor